MKSQFIILLLAFSAHVQAQGVGEWFQQGATQKKYLMQQIAALQVYIGYVQKGYSIAKDGLNTIGDIKKGEFNLHADYFNSLKTVSPTVRNYAKIAAIIALQIRIVQVYKNTSDQIRKGDHFNDDELNYVDGVFSRLLDDCAKTIDELTIVTTSGQLEMKDDERLKRIDEMYGDMQGKYAFVEAFSNEAKLLAASRIREQRDIRTSRAINGIK